MPTRRPILRTAWCSSLLVAVTFLHAPATAGDVAAELVCQPLYSLQDFRSIRPDDAIFSPSVTFYHFRNAEILHYSIAYRHNGHRPEAVTLNWPENLDATVTPHSGKDIENVSFDVLRRQVSERRFLLDGEPVTGPFLERAPGWSPQPDFEYDTYDDSLRDIESDAVHLQPQDQVLFDVKVVDGDGKPLDPGVYTLKIRDQRTGLACDEHLLILREPRSELDHADEWIVRYTYHEARGDADAATHAVRRATEVAPDCLQAWYFRMADAWDRADPEDWNAAADQMERILIERGGHVMAVSRSIQRSAHNALKHRATATARMLERVAERAEGDAQ